MEETDELTCHSFTLRPLFPRVEIPRTLVVGGWLSRCVPLWQDRNLLPVPGIEPRFLGHSARISSHYTDYAIPTPCNGCARLILTEVSLMYAAEEMHGNGTSLDSLGGEEIRVVWWKYRSYGTWWDSRCVRDRTLIVLWSWGSLFCVMLW
jgi:hypothetical protein